MYRELTICCLIVTATTSSVYETSTSTSHLTPRGWACGDETYPSSWICDGFNQCDDDSDEGKEPNQGCNLFPDSGCASFGGRRHYKCRRSGECFPDQHDADVCDAGFVTQLPSRACRHEDSGEAGWRCDDGRCVTSDQVCDGVQHCEDSSDEGHEEHQGCNKFPEVLGNCTSWLGKLHRPCLVIEEEGGQTVCTLDHLADSGDEAQCRECPDHQPGFWRCNDGWCINTTLVRNGVPDCGDGSDEDKQMEVGWVHLLVSTVSVVTLGIVISYLCRVCKNRNVKSFFHCERCCQGDENPSFYDIFPSCPSENKRKRPTHHRRSSSRCAMITKEEDDLIPNDDIPLELISLLEDKSSNWNARKRGGLVRQVTRMDRFSVTALKSEVISGAKCEYVLVHNDSIRFHHLYMYFANRCNNIKELAKVTKHLYSWEMELHHHNKTEVLKCWRLHLGCSTSTARIIDSVCEKPSLYAWWGIVLSPLRDCLRSIRRQMLRVRDQKDSTLDKVLFLSYSLLAPFLATSLFYFEQIKNLALAVILWNSVIDYSGGHPSELSFEFSLCLMLLVSFILTHSLFVLYSFCYAEEILEVSHTSRCRTFAPKVLLCKTFVVLFSPLVLSFIFANYVFYDSKVSRAKRHLQTLNDPSEEAITQDEVNKRAENKAERVKLYRYIYKLQNRRHLYRKLFSFYRVTSALLESVTVIIVMVILMFNKSDVKEEDDQESNNYRRHSFIALVEVRLAAFFGVQTRHNNMGIYVARDIILTFTLGYSFLVILTALVKYWHQAKNVSMTWMGQVVLGFYLCFLMVNKLTTAISILIASQTMTTSGHIMTVFMCLAFMLLLICLRLGLVYIYKRNFSRNWEVGDSMDKWMNIFVNTCVVIPFTLYQCPVAELKAKMAEFRPEGGDRDQPPHRRRSDPGLRREEILTALSQTRSEQDEVLPFLKMMEEKYPSQDQLREEILKLWWKNPSRKLSLCHVLDKVLEKHSEDIITDDDMGEMKVNIKNIIINLEVIGLINTPLLAPTPSRHEYFALFLLVLAENAISIGVEMLSGGQTGSSGDTYYSIDIRISCLFLALAFLLAYYYKYHLTGDLCDKSFSTWCRCGGSLVTEPPSEDAMQNILLNQKNQRTRKKQSAKMDMQTQTSFTPYNSRFRIHPFRFSDNRGDTSLDSKQLVEESV